LIQKDLIEGLIKSIDGPFFFYHLDLFRTHLQQMKSSLPEGIKIWYACKANPLSQVLGVLKEEGLGVDVASQGEFQQALKAGHSPGNIIATGPAKSYKYLETMLLKGVGTFVLESIQQLKDLNTLGQIHDMKPQALLRVQLDWPQELKSVLGGAAITPFGLSPADWKEIDLKQFSFVNIKGLHTFQWGNILDESALASIWEKSILECMQLSQELNMQLEVLDLGGGLGLSYGDERRLDFNKVAVILKKLKQDFSLPEIWLELGRFSIGEYGSYFTRIVDVKSVRGKDLLVLEGGINHIARPALTGEAFPCTALRQSNHQKTFTLHGPLCTALDHLGSHQLPHDLKAGEWLCFKKVGAYGFTEAMPYFLGHALAAEVCLYRGDILIPRAPQTLLSWMV
jgi:diaminopimelate decarboxylase